MSTCGKKREKNFLMTSAELLAEFQNNFTQIFHYQDFGKSA